MMTLVLSGLRTPLGIPRSVLRLFSLAILRIIRPSSTTRRVLGSLILRRSPNHALSFAPALLDTRHYLRMSRNIGSVSRGIDHAHLWMQGDGFRRTATQQAQSYPRDDIDPNGLSGWAFIRSKSANIVRLSERSAQERFVGQSAFLLDGGVRGHIVVGHQRHHYGLHVTTGLDSSANIVRPRPAEIEESNVGFVRELRNIPPTGFVPVLGGGALKGSAFLGSAHAVYRHAAIVDGNDSEAGLEKGNATQAAAPKVEASATTSGTQGTDSPRPRDGFSFRRKPAAVKVPDAVRVVELPRLPRLAAGGRPVRHRQHPAMGSPDSVLRQSRGMRNRPAMTVGLTLAGGIA